MSITKAFLITIAFIILTRLISLWVALGHLVDYNFLDWPYSRLVDGLLELLIVLVFLTKVAKLKLVDSFKVNGQYYIGAIILGILFVFAQSPLKDAYNIIFSTDYQVTYNFSLANIINPVVLPSILLIPVAEELLFRNYIQAGLLERANTTTSVIISSLLFASIHIPFVALISEYHSFNLHHAYITFFGGLISAILLAKTKKSGPSIVFHIFWNLTSYVI